MTKLSDRKIRYICRHVEDTKDMSVAEAAVHYGVTVRRVQQLTKKYRDTGQIPVLNKNRRPRSAPLSQREKDIINLVWKEKRIGARMMYHQLKNMGLKIPLHKIQEYYKATGRTKPNPRKQRKRKRCRYERKHSFSLLHTDWHRTSVNHPNVIVWLDDASRMILAGGEFDEATTEHSIATLEKAIEKAWEYHAIIREVNTDRGSQFFSNHPVKKNPHKFQLRLKERGIKHIVSRKNNPQTNGKVERFWLEYDRHRWAFSSLDEFIEWYNNRLHGALDLYNAETPYQAVIRKCPPEALLGMFGRLVKW